MLSLCSGETRAIHRDVLDDALQILHRHARHVLPGQNAAIIGDAQLVGDLARRQRMIAGDHDGPDAGDLARRPPPRVTSGSRRIDHADQPDEDQVALQLRRRDARRRRIGQRLGGAGEVVERLVRLLLDRLERDAQHAHALAGQLFVGGSDALAPRRVQRLGVIDRPNAAGDLDQAIDRAFGESHERTSQLAGQTGAQDVAGGALDAPAVPRARSTQVHRRHAFALRVERRLGHARGCLLQCRFPQPEARRRHDQRALGGIAQRVVIARPAGIGAQAGIVAQRAGGQQEGQRWLLAGVSCDSSGKITGSRC